MKEEVILTQKLFELDPSKVTLEHTSCKERFVVTARMQDMYLSISVCEDTLIIGSCPVEITKEEYLTLCLAFENLKKRNLQAQREKMAFFIAMATATEAETLLDIDYGE